MEQGTTLHVGLDVHARTIDVSVHGSGTRNREEWRLENEPRAVTALARRLRREGGGAVVCYYEAGPTGFALQRQRRLFALVGRLTRSARRFTLHLPARWPRADHFTDALARLRALPLPT